MSIGQNAEAAALVASLRDVIQKQAEEIEALQIKLKELSTAAEEVRIGVGVNLIFLTVIRVNIGRTPANTNIKPSRTIARFGTKEARC